ncbi:MAG: PBP1A family penicillin-binding protein [Desulforegulaceae bacterium]|nr:PBP1A family penicillin-binding protein [Desulforegulaceae bacterium]
MSITGLYQYYSKDLPKIKSLSDYYPPQVTEVFDVSGHKVAEFYKEKRILVPLNQMPKHLLQAFIAAEDARFYEHGGIDLVSIGRAFFKNINAGEIVQGGSTITQQVAKSFFLTPDKIYARKIKEAILAYRIDKYFSKEEVLYLYLNQIYLGSGAYGIEAAAQIYFGKTTNNLSLSESALLAGLPQAPSRYSPIRYFQRAKARQKYVLQQMVQNNFISKQDALNAFDQEIKFAEAKNFFMEKAPYYSEHIRKLILAQYGEEQLYKGGLNVYTALSLDAQRSADESLNKGLRELDKRQGYRGPLKRLSKDEIQHFLDKQKNLVNSDQIEPGFELEAVVVQINDKENYAIVKFCQSSAKIPIQNMSWARKPNPNRYYLYHKIKSPGQALKKNDLVLIRLVSKNEKTDIWEAALEQTPEVSGAILCIKAGSGEVTAMVGGKSFQSSQFNRAIQSKRQPGSAFKPIVYSAALDKGYTAASVIMDNAFVFHDKEQDFTWKPQNYNQTFYGPTLLRKALALSRNLVTIKLMKEIGIDYSINYSRKMGIVSHLDRDLSLALGSSGLSLLEMTNSYSVFANEGNFYSPVFIKKIENKKGEVLFEHLDSPKRVIPEETAYIMTSILKSVVEDGTGWRAKRLQRPVAGKTGTTNNLNDAWFVGYTTDYISGVWVGFDHEKSLGKEETGSKAASPIWTDFMADIHKGMPKNDFKVPKNIIFQRIDAETGLLPGPDTKEEILECFVKGTEPTKTSPAREKVKDKTDFFKFGM